MAYEITNRAKFKDDNGIYYELHILKDNYVGSISEFNVGGDGFKLSYKGRGEKVDTAIHSSEITFEFVLRDNDDRNRILDIMSQQEGKYIARIYMNNAGTEVDFESVSPVGRFWTGVIIMNESIMEDIDYPQIIKLRAIDGLELLKSKQINEISNIYNERTNETDATIKVADSNGDFEGGYYTFQSIILGILNQNPITEVFTDNVATDFLYLFAGNWWSSKTNVTEAQGYNDCSNIIICKSSAFYQRPSTPGGTIKYMTCYDVLNKILFYLNARIHQQEGAFHIVQLSTFEVWQDDSATTYGYYSKGGTAASGTVNYLKSLSSQSNKRSLTKFNFSRIIKRLIYNIAGVSEATPLDFTYLDGGQGIANQINFPGNQLQSAWHTFTEYTLTTDSTPAANEYKQTFLAVETGQNMTFIFNQSSEHVVNSFNASEWDLYNDFAARTLLIIRIKNDTQDYYLKFDPVNNVYTWDTTEAPVTTQGEFTLINGQNYSNYETVTYGAPTSDDMAVCPVSGLIQYYAYTQYYYVYAYQYDADGNAAPSVLVNITSQIEGDITSTAHPNYTNYDSPLDLPVASCQIYVDGETPSFVAYEYINEDAGTIVESGEEVIDSINFVEQFFPNASIADNLIYIKDSNTFQENNYLNAFTPSWTYINDTTGMSAVHLPSLKASTLIAMQKNYRMKMDTRLVRETDVLSLDPWEFGYLLKDTVEGSERYFVCLGGEYTATPGYFMGEWVEIDFNDLDKDGSHLVGNFTNHAAENANVMTNKNIINNKPPKVK